MDVAFGFAMVVEIFGMCLKESISRDVLCFINLVFEKLIQAHIASYSGFQLQGF
jgi:hypothetical protein